MLTGGMMFECLVNRGRRPSGRGSEGVIKDKTGTYDFARLMEGAKDVACSEFGQAIVDATKRMKKIEKNIEIG